MDMLLLMPVIDDSSVLRADKGIGSDGVLESKRRLEPWNQSASIETDEKIHLRYHG